MESFLRREKSEKDRKRNRSPKVRLKKSNDWEVGFLYIYNNSLGFPQEERMISSHGSVKRIGVWYLKSVF